jgi:hypothetical protein
VKPTIVTEKVMLTVFLSINGAVLINWLPYGGRFNTSYFCNEILRPLSETMWAGRREHAARPIIHMDNATPHKALMTTKCFEECRFLRAPQPPYSPDISSCNFFLFGDVKRKLQNKQCETMEELKYEVELLLGLIPLARMRDVFQNWRVRL